MRLWRGLRFWLVLLVVWSIPALAGSVIAYIRALQQGPADWKTGAWAQFPFWYLWVPLTALILWLGNRFPIVSPRWRRHLGLHLLVSAAVSLTHLSIGLIFLRAASTPPPVSPYSRQLWTFLATYFEFNMLIYGGVLLAGHAVASYRNSRLAAIRTAQLEAQLAEARLETLRMQLHPHFLFNALHTISALMARDLPAARRMMTRLSDLLRFSLETDTGEEVPLSEEIEFLERYVEIQLARFSDRLDVTFEIDHASQSVMVPRFALQPLVENAIRHGIDRRQDSGGRVVIRSRMMNGRLRLEVEDNGPGLAADEPAAREGVGLRSTRARLEHLYGAESRFTLGGAPEGGALALIEIPARREPGEQA